MDDQIPRYGDVPVYYLSDGEYPSKTTLDALADNLRESYAGSDSDAMTQETGYHTVEALILDIAEAVDKQGFWHGTLTCYNVAIVGLHLIAKIEAGT